MKEYNLTYLKTWAHLTSAPAQLRPQLWSTTSETDSTGSHYLWLIPHTTCFWGKQRWWTTRWLCKSKPCRGMQMTWSTCRSKISRSPVRCRAKCFHSPCSSGQTWLVIPPIHWVCADREEYAFVLNLPIMMLLNILSNKQPLSYRQCKSRVSVIVWCHRVS